MKKTTMYLPARVEVGESPTSDTGVMESPVSDNGKLQKRLR